MKFAIIVCLSLVSVIYADLPCTCRLGTESRIINGQYAPVNLTPWIVSIATLDGSHFCGGSIINENWILTAAHCTQGKQAEEVLVRVGLHVLNDINMQSKTYRAKAIHQFNDFTPGKPGDFAMVEIHGPIQFVPKEIEPGCLNLVETQFPENLMTAGWGYTSRSYQDPQTGAVVPTSNVSPILKYYFAKQVIETCFDHDICTLALDPNDSSCQGDSGGPLHYNKDGKTTIIGITSYGLSQPHEGKNYYCVSPTAFARLSLYAQLIEQLVGKNYCA